MKNRAPQTTKFPDPNTAKYKLKVWFSGSFKPSDGLPRTFYSFDRKNDNAYGFNKLVQKAEQWRKENRWSAAEIYRNDPGNEDNEILLLKLLPDGRRTAETT